ncbi:MAG: threonine synthase, partial [Pseudomonadota bacterium]
MRYVSTRGVAPVLDFEGALLAGLATDGGLYLPATLPTLSAREWRALRGAPYAEVAAAVIAPFAEGCFSREQLDAICRESYAQFDHAAVAPLVQISADMFVLELHHGPTLAFKDYAMQVLGRMFDTALKRRGQRATIVGATSGDTGPAAMAACGGRSNIDVFILFPDGRTSPV